MSYCVNCGVELDSTAEKCILCNTVIQNPNSQPDTSSPRPYASAMTTLYPIYRRYAAFIIGMVMLSICGVCLTVNLFFLETGSWFMIVLGAAVSMWMTICPPLLFPDMSKHLYIALVGAAYCATEVLIGLFTQSMGWVWMLAIPITISAMLLIILYMFLRGQFRLRMLGAAAVSFALLGVFTVIVELLINYYLDQKLHPVWSILVLVCCAAVDIVFFAISKTKVWKEEAKRRLRL